MSLLRVVGKGIYDGQTKVSLRGVEIWSNILPSITLQRLQQIKGWGFNTIMLYFFWSQQIEPNQAQPGVYNEAMLQSIENVVQLAQQAGLYVLPALRVTHAGPWWQGWVTIEQFESDLAVRQRFYNTWTMMIERFDRYDNIAGWIWWLYPWHEPVWGAREPARLSLYNDEVIPTLLALTRARSNKMIFHTAYRQGSTYNPYPWAPPGWTLEDTNEFLHMTPINDPNVVYCFGNHGPKDANNDVYVELTSTPWNYDMVDLRAELQPGIDFSNKYNVPMMVTEVGMFTRDIPFSQSRRDCLEAKMDIWDENDWNWVYWSYSNGGEDQSLVDVNWNPLPIVDVLRAHATNVQHRLSTSSDPSGVPFTLRRVT